MALKVWLPLNGNIENKGLIGGIYNSGELSFADNGKIGKGMDDGWMMMSAEQTASILNNNEFSLCFWIYINTDDTTLFIDTQLFGNNPMSEINNRKYSIFNYPTANDIHWSWMNDAASTTFTSGELYGVLPSYKWTHVCVTYSNPNGKWYINGQLHTTFTGVSNSSSFAYDTYLMRTNSKRRILNDYRIYDHCLSADEVKRISQALILHYPLNDPAINTNLIKGDYWCKSTNNTYEEHGSIQCMVSSDMILANQGRTLYLSVDICNEGEIGHTTTDPSSWKYERFGAHGDITINGSQRYPLADLLSLGKSSGRYTASWTIPTGISTASDLYIWPQCNPADGYCRPAANNNSTWYWKNIKLEWDRVTSYTPYLEEMNSFIIHDCAGYGHNGIIINDILPKLDSPSPRYSNCYDMGNDTSTSIEYNFGHNTQIRNNDLLNINNCKFCTIAFWVNPIASHSLFSLSNNVNCQDYQNRIMQHFDNKVWVGYPNNSISFIPIENSWNHYTFVFNAENSILKSYRNGVCVDSSVIGTDPMTTINYAFVNYCHAGSIHRGSACKMSDFRLYMTALSDNDILELYNTSAKITKNGTSLCYEIKEQQ